MHAHKTSESKISVPYKVVHFTKWQMHARIDQQWTSSVRPPLLLLAADANHAHGFSPNYYGVAHELVCSDKKKELSCQLQQGKKECGINTTSVKKIQFLYFEKSNNLNFDQSYTKIYYHL